MSTAEQATVGPPSTSDADDPLLAWREHFPILAGTNYLISNSLGAVPAETQKGLLEYFDLWAARGVRAWQEAWWTMVAECGDLVAPLINAGQGEVAFHPNVTLAHAVLFSAIDFDDRPRVVTDAMHFPSILYLMEGLRVRGAEIIVVPSDDGVSVETGQMIDAIDSRTAMVCLSHVLFKSAYIHEAGAICTAARELGAVSILDGYQAVGVIPVDVEALGVDVYIGGVLKWLCGGPGGAFMWVRPELAPTLSPALTGWLAHVSPFDFAPELNRRDDAWRFLNGTPNVPALYAARPGLEIIGQVGVAAIREKSMRQTTRLLELANARGLTCTTPREPAKRGGTIAVDVPNGLAISRALKSEEIICDYRPGAGIRLSPHFYTRDAELDQAMDAIVRIIESGEWKAHADERETVT